MTQTTYAWMVTCEDGYYDPPPGSYSLRRKWANVTVSGPDEELVQQIGQALQELATNHDWRQITKICDGINARGVFRVNSSHSQVLLYEDRMIAALEAKRAEAKAKAEQAAALEAERYAQEQAYYLESIKPKVYCAGCKWPIEGNVYDVYDTSMCENCAQIEQERIRLVKALPEATTTPTRRQKIDALKVLPLQLKVCAAGIAVCWLWLVSIFVMAFI